MAKFNIPISFCFTQAFEVEAKTPEEAAEKLNNDYNNGKLDAEIAARMADIARDKRGIGTAVSIAEIWEDCAETV